MQTLLSESFRHTPEGKQAQDILRNCVHCGFCTATCPTYQLLGDELDGPRGRIYLIKSTLEGEAPGRKTQRHLDRCLTCRSCETTCPSGVQYGRLLDIGRQAVDARVKRPLLERLSRRMLRALVPYPRRFGLLYALGRFAPRSLTGGLYRTRRDAHATRKPDAGPLQRRMLVLESCVQSVAAPATNAAAARVLARLGIELTAAPGAGCCGAISHHLGAADEARDFMRRNIDAWWPQLEAGAEAIVMTASGCGAMVREYGHILRDDPEYADKAARVSECCLDLCEVLECENLDALAGIGHGRRIAWHPPCTLQHGLKIHGTVERILQQAGFELAPVRDKHLCCGSAGTYSLLQKKLSRPLLDNKLVALQAEAPELIVTANIGCQLHLAGAATVPVRHWIELLDEVDRPQSLPRSRDPFL